MGIHIETHKVMEGIYETGAGAMIYIPSFIKIG
jgi:hypothetical protein